MTARPCPLTGCGAELAADEHICRGCGRLLAVRLRAVPAMLDDLDTTLAGIGSSEPTELRGGLTGGCRPGCDHAPDNPSCVAGVTLDVDLAASEAAAQLRSVLHGWVRVWDEETPLDDSPDPLGPVCRWLPCGHESCRLIGLHSVAKRLAKRVRAHALGTAARQALLLADQDLRGRAWAPDIAAEIRDAVRKAERAVDTPPAVTLAGTCPCGAAVYAVAGDSRARCRACGTSHDPAALHDAMIDARGHLHAAPAAVIARMLVDPTTGQPLCTAAQIRGWRHRGALEVTETNAAGQPCYRIDDVARLARDGAPQAEEHAEPERVS